MTILFQIRDLTHLVNPTILKETMKLQGDEQVYALVFSNKSVSNYDLFNGICMSIAYC